MSDFFTLRNINIGYLIIDGDYGDKLKIDPFLNHETNNILFFEDKFQTFVSKIKTHFADLSNFMSLGLRENNDEGNNY